MPIPGRKGEAPSSFRASPPPLSSGAADSIPGPIRGKVLVGTAGWIYKDWEGTVYPKPAPRGFDPLVFLLEYVDAIEVNSTFYRPPSASSARSWAARAAVHPRRRLTVKLWRGFSHERRGITKQDVTLFRKGIEPLLEEGLFGCLLMQFPWSFKNTEENRVWLNTLFKAFEGLPRAVEIRHASWNQPALLRWLADKDIGFVNIDQPVIGQSIGRTAHASGPVGYVRMHGRNASDWFREDAGRDARYDYLYTREEIEPWLSSIRRIAGAAPETYVILNNHFRGQALVNAIQIRRLLTGAPRKVPADLLRHYPELDETL
jgi:uncharacterized protein YecE (DUF72 family)